MVKKKAPCLVWASSHPSPKKRRAPTPCWHKALKFLVWEIWLLGGGQEECAVAFRVHFRPTNSPIHVISGSSQSLLLPPTSSRPLPPLAQLGAERARTDPLQTDTASSPAGGWVLRIPVGHGGWGGAERCHRAGVLTWQWAREAHGSQPVLCMVQGTCSLSP